MSNAITRIEIRFNTNFGTTNWVVVSKVAFYDSSGALLSNTGITPRASSVYADWIPGRVLDNNQSYDTGCWSPSGDPLPQYLWFDFASATDVGSVHIYNSDTWSANDEHAKNVVVTATHTDGQTTSVSATRPSSAANAYTTHSIPGVALQPLSVLPALDIAQPGISSSGLLASSAWISPSDEVMAFVNVIGLVNPMDSVSHVPSASARVIGHSEPTLCIAQPSSGGETVIESIAALPLPVSLPLAGASPVVSSVAELSAVAHPWVMANVKPEAYPFGFKTSVAPQLIPLKNSHATDDIEAELYQLALDLFKQFENQAFDAINAGAGHLCTLDLVRRSMTSDGLAVIKSDIEELVTRYLYRAWIAANEQGRGLHFLRTYMQMLFPNNWIIQQLQQPKVDLYPSPRLTGWTPGSEVYEGYFLTSRLRIGVDAQHPESETLPRVAPALTSVIPARFLPKFALYKRMESDVRFACAMRPGVRQSVDLKTSIHLGAIPAPLRTACALRPGVRQRTEVRPFCRGSFDAAQRTSCHGRASQRWEINAKTYCGAVLQSTQRTTVVARPSMRVLATMQPI